MNPLSDADMPLMADVLDAIDPALDEDQRLAAARRAVTARPLLALVTATSLLNGMISGLPDPAGVMAQLRRGSAASHREVSG